MTDNQVLKTLENIKKHCANTGKCIFCDFMNNNCCCSLYIIVQALNSYPATWDIEKIREEMNKER